jgi:membrane protease YdiL (CAAX protease family)
MAQGVLKAVGGLSFLLVLMILLAFLYTNSFATSALFPENPQGWNTIIGAFLLIFVLAIVGSLIFAPEFVKGLAKANYWKAFVFRFIPSALVYGIALIAVKVLLKGDGGVNLFDSISYMPLSVLLLHALVIAQVEEILFGGLIYSSIQKRYGHNSANWITTLLFSLFHFSRAGGNWVVLATYVPLRLWFNYTRNNGIPLLSKLPGVGDKYFGPTPQTQQSNAGAHFAWNAFIIGFIEPFR